MLNSKQELENLNRTIKRLGLIINLMSVVIKIAKYLTPIVFSFATLSILLSIKDFIEASYGFGIINLALGVGGLVFVIQSIQWRNKERNRIRNENLILVTSLPSIKYNTDRPSEKRKIETEPEIAN